MPVARAAAPVPQLVPQVGHSDRVSALAMAPAGDLLASGGDDRRIKVWRIDRGQLVQDFAFPEGPVTAIAFSPKYLAAAGSTSVRVWDPISGKLIKVLKHHSVKIKDIAFSTDGAGLIASSRANYLWTWDTRNWRVNFDMRVKTGGVSAVAPDGHTVAIGSHRDGRIRLWDLRTQKSVGTLSGHNRFFDSWRGRYSVVYALAQCPNRPVLVSADREEVKVWNTSDGTRMTSFEVDGKKREFTALAVSSDCRTVATASGPRTGPFVVHLWHLETGQRKMTLGKSDEPITELLFATDDSRLLTAGGSPSILGRDRSIRVWSLSSGRVERRLGGPAAEVEAVRISGDLMATLIGDQQIALWDLEHGVMTKVLRPRTDRVRDIAIQAATKTLVTVGFDRAVKRSRVKTWDVVTGQPRRSFDFGSTSEGARAGGLGGDHVAISPRGLRVAANAPDHSIRVWTTDGTERATTTPHRFTIKALAFSPDGKVLASVPWASGDLTIWNAQTGALIRTMKDRLNNKLTVAFDRAGRRIAAADISGAISVFDVDSGTALQTFVRKAPRYAYSGTGLKYLYGVDFAHDGRRVVAGAGDGTVTAWDLDATDRPRRLTRHATMVRDVKVLPGTDIVASASSDGTVRFTQLATGALLATAVTVAQDDWLVFTPEGFFDGSRRAWRAVPFRFQDEPTVLYAPEQFFNQFFQPGLLADIIRSGATMRRVLQARGDPRAALDIAGYRRSKLPAVKMMSTSAGSSTDDREITVAIQTTDKGSGVRDLRVFRNQSLVHFEHGVLRSKPESTRAVLSVPIKLVSGANEIRAYAFNDLGLKSPDAVMTVSRTGTAKNEATAYIVGIGINRYRDASINLRYAVPDAKAMMQSLSQSMGRLDRYARVVSVGLLDEAATKANIIGALDILAGKRTPADLPEALQALRAAQPEDAVIVFFAGHGLALGDRYYLLSHKATIPTVAKGGRTRSLPDRLRFAVSDNDLEAGFEGVDASDILLVIDACQSGQVLEAKEKRRGPLNVRGLAQLAYEKGMHVLAAAQSFQAALEFEKLGHGLLTYTLIEKGLHGAADATPRDRQLTVREWLDYAVETVPSETQAAEAELATRVKRGLKRVSRPIEGQAPRAYYRRERVGRSFVISRY